MNQYHGRFIVFFVDGVTDSWEKGLVKVVRQLKVLARDEGKVKITNGD